MANVALEGRGLRTPGLTARRWRQAGAVVIGWAAFFGVWAFASEVLFNPYRLPGPLTVADAMWTIVKSGDVLTTFKASLGKIFLGFGLAAVHGTPIGFLMG